MTAERRHPQPIISGREITPPRRGVNASDFLCEVRSLLPEGAIVNLVDPGDPAGIGALESAVRDFVAPDAPRVEADGWGFMVLPRPRRLKCSALALHATDRCLEALARFLDDHNTIEMCTHLHVSLGDAMMLEFHDFPDNTFFLWDRIDEDHAMSFAASLGCRCRRYEPDLGSHISRA